VAKHIHSIFYMACIGLGDLFVYTLEFVFTLFRQLFCQVYEYSVFCSGKLPVYQYSVVKNIVSLEGRAVAQRLGAGFPPRRPGFAYGQHVGFVVDKTALGQVFSEYFGFPCQSIH
jgi:hypothetical protein